MDLNTWYEWLGLIVAIGTIMFGAGGVLLRMGAMVRAIVHFADAVPDLLALSAEFKPNGGGSLRDAVDRVEANQKADHEIVVSHIQDDKAFQDRVEPALLAQGR